MKLTIVSLKGKSEHQVAWLEANTPDGNFVIQPHHTPTTFILSEQKDFTYCLTTGKLETITIKRSALLSINRREAFLLID